MRKEIEIGRGRNKVRTREKIGEKKKRNVKALEKEVRAEREEMVKNGEEEMGCIYAYERRELDTLKLC